MGKYSGTCYSCLNCCASKDTYAKVGGMVVYKWDSVLCICNGRSYYVDPYRDKCSQYESSSRPDSYIDDCVRAHKGHF